MQGWMEIGDWLWVSGVAATGAKGASVHATLGHGREGGSDGSNQLAWTRIRTRTRSHGNGDETRVQLYGCLGV